MTQELLGSARATGLAYYHAWTSGDVEGALSYLSPDVVCDAPRAGRILGVDAYRPVLNEYVQILTGSTLVAAHGDEESALMYYVNETALVAKAPTVDYLEVVDGRITYLTFLFDRLPFEKARRSAGTPSALDGDS
jgi:ketosteroid isomerase-like protein